MKLSKPEDIAKYFQESVKFDFKKETIFSFQQIEESEDDFYALIDKDAFTALLNDIVGYDNQLKDIFSDIFDSGLGIHRFADNSARNSPRSLIISFLNKYAYHQNDIAKVYLAFNTWLIFFDCETISPDWSRCPFCGSKVSSGACTNKTCKKINSNFMTAAYELAELLAIEKDGKISPTPEYWDYIDFGSEFYIEYKLPIQQIREARSLENQKNLEKRKAEAIEQALPELNSIRSLFNIEATKSVPDFDSILTLISQNPKINAASQYDDKSFNRKISLLTKDISKKKAEFDRQYAELQDIIKFSFICKRFMELLSLLKGELETETRSLEDFKSNFEKLDNTYHAVTAAIASGCKLENTKYTEAIAEYEASLKTKFAEHISQKEYEAFLLEKETALVKQTNIILDCLNGIEATDDKSTEISQMFASEIEQNAYFDDFRVECRAKYSDITDRVRNKLSELIIAEKISKTMTFKHLTDKFIKELDNSQPYESNSVALKERLNIIESDKYFDSIRGTKNYKKAIRIISEKIAVLENLEQAYKQEMEAAKNEELKKQMKRKKRKKRRIIILLLLLTLAVAFVICKLTGILPTDLLDSGFPMHLFDELSIDIGISDSFDALYNELIIICMQYK